MRVTPNDFPRFQGKPFATDFPISILYTTLYNIYYHYISPITLRLHHFIVSSPNCSLYNRHKQINHRVQETAHRNQPPFWEKSPHIMPQKCPHMPPTRHPQDTHKFANITVSLCAHNVPIMCP
jgi:hypothetical protein